MQIDLSTMTPATRAVFDALHYLGQGNVHELHERSGKARSTVDKAIKALADAGLIVPVDTDADPAEGVPTRWTMAEGVAESVTADDTDLDTDTRLDNTDTAGDETDFSADNEADQPSGDDNPQPSTQPVNGDPAEQDDRNTAAEADQHNPHAENLTATSSGDNPNDADAEPDESEDGDQDEEADADDADDSDDSDEADDEDDEDESAQGQARFSVMQPSRPGDRKVMALKGVLGEFGDDGATLDEIVAESGIGHPIASRLLAAMEQAEAARRLPGTPSRWITGPTKASDVDPNPQPLRCVLCRQVVKGLTESPEAVAQILPLVRPDGTLQVLAEDGTAHVVTLPKRLPTRVSNSSTAGAVRRTDLTVNSDGNQPFAKGELERLTLAVLSATPGREMTPQEITTEISARLNGRAVSSGAVRNNCTKAAAKGDILMVRDAPLTFAHPAPAGGSEPSQAEQS